MKYALLLLFVLACGVARAQFWMYDGELLFYLQDAQGNFIRNATVKANGKTMRYTDTCRYLPNREGYAVKFDVNRYTPRIRLTVQHPDYLPYDDSVSTSALVFLFKPTDKTYVYKKGKSADDENGSLDHHGFDKRFDGTCGFGD